MQISTHILPGYAQSAEEKLISEMERSRSEVFAMRSEPLKDPDAFKNAKERYGTLRENLSALRGKDNTSAKESEKRRSVLNTYLERRLFNSEFPDDARRLETYCIYTSKGIQRNFSFSSLEYVGSNIDATV